MIRVQDIRLTLDEDKSSIKNKIAKKLKISPKDILDYTIFKEAIDARRKNDIKLIYTVDVKTTKEKALLKKNPNLKAPDLSYAYVETGSEELSGRPVIVGTGPCGLFAGLILARMGYKPILVERGKKVEERAHDVELFWKEGVLNPNSNVQFGEGGAGTFSDGKLTTQIKNKRCHKVLKELADAGAPQEIRYKHKPHVGTDVLREVVKNIREKIEELGGEFRFNACVTNIKIEDHKIVGVEINHEEVIDTGVCVLAIGHSARDTFEMLNAHNVYIEQKPFSVGMRIEHLQRWIDEAQYGKAAGHKKLGAAEYKIVHHAENGRGVYSFCMCPGGYVVASASEEGRIVTNGMSEHKRDGVNSNSAILVSVGPEDFGADHPLAGMYMQREFEALAYKMAKNTYKAPAQRVEDFLENRATIKAGVVQPTYRPGVTYTNIREQLPTFIGEAIAEAMPVFGKRIKNFDHPDALFTGFETRSSSPVRIRRDDLYQSNIRGLYPAGEGAGYAGGITSAAVDGVEVAESIARKYKPLT